MTLRNDSGQLGTLLQPYLTNRHFKNQPFDPFTTEKSESLIDRGEAQRHENLKLEKDDLRFTRRILENSNNKSIGTAIHVTKTLGCRADAVARMKQYFSGSTYVERGRPKVMEHDLEEDWEWTPCRYATSGWKYQKKGTQQKHLNHYNKLNCIASDGARQHLMEAFNIK